MSYMEPVLTITAVHDSGGRPVPQVEVVRYRRDGVPMLQQLRFDIEQGTSWSPERDTATFDAGLHSGLSLHGDGRVTCTVPCAFGSNPGTVDLGVVAQDGQRSARSLEVHHRGRRPGCGGALNDGTDVDLVLDRPRT
ncbi:hypothetical protein [Nocardioides sp.]|uniref:hypothetical protein n=1 Tax=Nocardioides sp. TaxID=35761 RepID=UPI002722A44A|nr:hypothetical protein [Nocardioides sp.]MDO9458253.1 hypothetical protein [Nocardioides sp.]